MSENDNLICPNCINCTLIEEKSNEWWATLAKQHYGGNPYGRIIEMAKKAQKVGVIKGILLHQGCSNCGNPNWPNMVKKIYNDMLTDLGLAADSVPLFVGEVEYTGVGAQSGGCAGHNAVVAKIPSVIPTGYVISAKDCEGNETAIAFCAQAVMQIIICRSNKNSLCFI